MSSSDSVRSSHPCSSNLRPQPKQRLLVVANRLPVSAVRRGEESWALDISAGGLVSALSGVKEFDAKWIGWAGVDVPDEVGQKALSDALAEERCIPVFLGEELVDQYYNGYCNNVLWPLFHYLGLPQEDHHFSKHLVAFKKANAMFAEVVLHHYQEGDVVWCHDYHLMFLPECLKERNTNIKVGWFLHTPFPSFEIYRALPSGSELLKAVLAADLVGFHTNDYARHFVSACTRILELQCTPEGVEDAKGRLTRVAADEDVYKFFEPELPSDIGYPRTILPDPSKSQNGDKKGPSPSKPSSKSSHQKPCSKANGSNQNGSFSSTWSVLDLDKEKYFSCAVGRNQTRARYTLASPDEVVCLLSRLAE